MAQSDIQATVEYSYIVTYVIAIEVDIPMYRILNYRRRVMCARAAERWLGRSTRC